MTYAEHRRIIDVDSHLFELDDFLVNAARDAHRAKIRPMNEQKQLPYLEAALERGRELLAKRQKDPAAMAKFEASLLDNSKSGWSRLGAFDSAERSHALDLLGFEMQMVLPTFAFHQVAHAKDDDLLEAGAYTLNSAMSDFCRDDDRLRAIGYVPLSLGPKRAKEILDQALQDGCFSLMVDTNEPDDNKLSFTHPDFDPIWATFADADTPFCVHVAANGHYRSVPRSFNNNGKSELALGGDAPMGELGLQNIGQSAQLFLSAMIYDGVFERHPNLRSLCMEHAATWLPSWLREMDFTAHMYKRKRKFAELPSETAKQRIKVSPFSGEQIGWIIDNVGPDMLVFASDYPHPEGGSNPIKRFEDTMQNCDQKTMDAFYHGNMQSMLNLPA